MKFINSEQLCVVAGLDAFALLEKAFRGCLVYIPATEKASNAYKDLVAIVGAGITSDIIRHLGGHWVYFKKRNLEQLRENNARIAASYRGQPMIDFANMNRISITTAYLILKNAGIKTGKKGGQGKCLM